MGIFSHKVVWKCTGCGYEEKEKISYFSNKKLMRAAGGQKACPKCGKIMVQK